MPLGVRCVSLRSTEVYQAVVGSPSVLTSRKSNSQHSDFGRIEKMLKSVFNPCSVNHCSSYKTTFYRGLQESLCISLACYPSPVKNGERKTVDQLSALPSCWPKKGGMTMNVLYEGRREEFSLSPPFMVRVAQLHLMHPQSHYRLQPMA